VRALLLTAFALGAAAGACASGGGSGGTGGPSGTAGQSGSAGPGTAGASGASGGARAGAGAGGASSGGAGGASGSGGAAAGGAAGASGSAGAGGTGGAGGRGGAGGTGGTGGTGGSSGAGGASGAGGSSGGAGTTAIVIPGAGSCTAPTGANPADAAAAYAKWKTDLLTSDGANGFLRVKRPNSSGGAVNSTVSEGIAYGMLLSVYANDQPTFDKLWQYSQHWLDSNGLMNWYISPDGTQTLGTGGASDADEDMAYALCAADARWGGKGSLATNYIDLAKTQINLIWQHEVDHTSYALLPGDTGFDGSVINISYFAPAYYKVFGKVTGQTANWNNAAKASYDIIERTLNSQNGNINNGLVPAWSTPAGVPMAPPGTGMPTYHQLDSCRTPFRIGVDYCWNAEPRALTYLQKITGFYSGVGAASIVDGYDLNGNPHPTNVTTGGPRAASFNGAAGVGAMATGATGATLRDQAYAGVATLTELAGSTYYQESWTGLTLQMMTGLVPVPR
jgi:endo-1,4-beta-D-glucanase Y